MSEVQRVRLGQPYVPVDPGAFVEPAISEAGIHADDQKILAAVIQKIGDVKAKGRIAIVVAAHERAVQEDERAAEGAVELDPHAPAFVFFRNVEGAPVPAHAGFGIAAAQRLVAVTLQLRVAHKGQLNRPVVRQVQRTPFGVVKFFPGKLKLAGLGEIPLALAESQVAQRVAGVSLKKLPAKIEQQMLARSHRGHRLRRRCARIARQQRMRAAQRTCDQG